MKDDTGEDKDLQRLYQKVILHHAHSPDYKGTPEEKKYHATYKNPLCGDVITLGSNFSTDNLLWNGEGCIICLAATDIFCKIIASIGTKNINFLAESLLEDYEKHTMICKDFMAFRSIKDIPTRIKCVTLVAHTAKILIRDM